MVAWGSFDFLRVAKSTDLGRTWSDPVLLDGPHDDGYESAREVVLETDRLGHWVAAWMMMGPGDSGWGRPIASCSKDDGKTWSKPVVLGGADISPVRVAHDDKGLWMIGWASYGIYIVRSVDFGLTWTPPQEALHAEYQITGQFLHVDKPWEFYATDYKFNPQVTVSEDDGQTWKGVPPSEVAIPPDAPTLVRRERGKDNVWVAANTLYHGRDHDLCVWRSVDGRKTWSKPTVIANGTYCLDLRTDNAGCWVMAWAPYEGPYKTSDVFFVRSTDNGEMWSKPATLNNMP